MTGWDPDDAAPKRLIGSASLVEDSRPGARRGLIGLLVNAVVQLTSTGRSNRAIPSAAVGIDKVPRATPLVQNAVDSRLTDSSIDADIAIERIASEYQKARLANSETPILSQEKALQRLDAVLSLCEALGVSTKPERLDDGRIALVVGLSDLESDERVPQPRTTKRPYNPDKPDDMV